MKTKKMGLKGGFVLSFAFALLICLSSAIFGIIGSDKADYASADNSAVAVAETDDGSNDTAPANPGDGTQAHPYILWGNTLNKATVWAKAVNESVISGKTVFVKLASNWVATEHDTYNTSFAGADDYSATAGTMVFNTGAIQIPTSASIDFDLAGHVIDRAETEFRSGSRAFVVCGDFSLRDSNPSAVHSVADAYSKEIKTVNGGLITGCTNGAIYGLSACSITINGGTFAGNSSDSGAVLRIYDSSKLTINDCDICYNYATSSGGMVYLTNSTMDFLGGKLHDNTADSVSGVYSNISIVTIENAEFFDNTVLNGKGVLYASAGVLNFNSGAIHDNYSYVSDYGQGVAAYVVSTCEFYMRGGEIYNNYGISRQGHYEGIIHIASGSYAELTGGKVYDNKLYGYANIFTRGRVKIGGDFEVYNNIMTGSREAHGGGIVAQGSSNYISSVSLSGSPLIGYKREAGGNIVQASNTTSASYDSATGTFTPKTDAAHVSDLSIKNSDRINISFDGAFTGKIGVNKQDPQSGVFTSFFGKYNNNADYDYTEHFVPNNTAQEIVTVGTGADAELAVRYKSSTELYAPAPSWDGFIVKPIFRTRESSTATERVPFVMSSFGCELASITRTYGTDNSVETYTYDASTGKYKSEEGKYLTVELNTSDGNSYITLPERGKYGLNFELEEGYAWSVGATGTKSLTVYYREIITQPTWASGYSGELPSPVYTGEEQGFGFKMASADAFTVTVAENRTGEAQSSRVEVNGTSGTAYATDINCYRITFTLNSNEYVRANATAATSSTYGLYFYIRKHLERPSFSDGSTVQYLTLTGNANNDKVDFTSLSEGVTVTYTKDGEEAGTLTGLNSLSFTEEGTYVITFTIPDHYKYLWDDMSQSTKTLTVYVKNYVAGPEWADGYSSTVKYLQSDGTAHTLGFTYGSGVGVTLTKNGGEPQAVTGNSITATEAGKYVLTFTLPEEDGGKYMWEDGSTALTKSLTFYVSETLNVPVWDDGTSGVKQFNILLDGSNNFLSQHIVNIPKGVTVASSAFGPQVTYTANGGEVTCAYPGTYTLTFKLHDGYVWQGNSVANKTLTFVISDKVAVPVWSDGTNSSKYINVNANGSAVTQSFTLDPDSYVSGLNYVSIAGTTYSFRITNDANGLSVGYTSGGMYAVTATASNPSVSGLLGTLPAEVNFNTKTITVTVDKAVIILNLANNTVSGNVAGQYSVVVSLANPVINSWDGTYSNLNLYLMGATKVAAPTWQDGTNAIQFIPYAAGGMKIYVYDLPEGAYISHITSNTANGNAYAEINGNEITVWELGAFSVHFNLTDKSLYSWVHGGSGEYVLNFSVVEYISNPVWNDTGYTGTTESRYLKVGSTATLKVKVDSRVKVTCSNPNLTISETSTGYTFSASEVGTYTLTFTLPNSRQYCWPDNTTGAVTLTFYITGATEVETPVFEETFSSETLVKDFSITSNRTFKVTLPAGVTVLPDVVNSDGNVNGKAVDNGDGTATITLTATGTYYVYFVIDTDGYCWADGTVSSTKSLCYQLRNSLSVPSWADGTTGDKYVSYNANGVSLEFVISNPDIIVSTDNTDLTIIGSTVTATKPGMYVINFTVLDKYGYMWQGENNAAATKTLTFYITGGTKVQAPSWADGTTGTQYITAGSGKTVLTYKLPEGVSVSVSSNTSPATVTMVGGAAQINATAVGTYTVTFKITDTSKYVWADNSVSETKTLTLVVTSKTLVDIPTWADGTTDDKIFELDGKTDWNSALIYNSANVEVGLNGSISGSDAYITDGVLYVDRYYSGELLVTFTLKDPANVCWADGTTAPKTLRVYKAIMFELPEWKEGGTDRKYLDYNASGNTLNIIYSFDNPYYFTYVDENGVNRGKMTHSSSGDVDIWTVTFNGKTVTLQFTGGKYEGSLQPAQLKATAPGTYIFTQNLQGYPDNITSDLWADGTQTTKTLTFTINPEGAEKVSFPEWADGGDDVLYFDYNGENQTLLVKDGEPYAVTSVSSPATFRGNEITFKGVGKYTVTISLTDVKKYVWEDGTTGTKTLTFYVTGATEVAVPSWSDGSTSAKGFTYDGSAHSVTVAELDEGVEIVSWSAGITQNGLTFSATGSSSKTTTYTITFGLTDATLYKWSDGTVGNKTLTFTVIAGNRVIIDTPEDETVTYSGKNINVYLDNYFDGDLLINGNITCSSITNGGQYTDAITVTVKDAGTYVVTLHLTSTAHDTYIWSNGSSSNYEWTITVLKGSADMDSIKLDTYEGMYDGKAHPATLTGVPSWLTANVTYKNASGKTVTENDIKNAGTYTVEVTFSHSNPNYNQVKETLTGTIVIEKAVLSVKWTGQEVYDYNNGNPVILKAEIFGAVNGETVPYTVYLNGTSAIAGSAIGKYTAKVVLGAGASNYTFAGGKTEVTYSYEIKNLSTEITGVSVTFSQSGITLKNTDELEKVLSGISKVTITYSNGFSEDIAEGYTLAGDFGAANPYFTVCYGGAQSANISVTVSEIIELSSVRVEEVENISSTLTVGELKELLEVKATYVNGASKTLSASAFKLLENGTELKDGDTLSEGKHTLTVSYTQGAVTKTDEVQITVEGVVLSEITATLAEGAKIYAGTSEEELKSALTVTAVYSDGSKAPAVGYTLAYEPFTAGASYEITITYNGKTVKITGTVEADESVTVTAEWLGGGQAASGIPPVYEYTDIDEIRNYIVVKANGQEVSGYLLSGTLEAGKTCTLTVTYANETAEISVTVSATPASVEYKGERATFSQGNTVIFANTSLDALKDLLKVEELYDEDGVEIIKQITDYTITGTLTGGQSCTLTATWGDKSATFTVYVTAVAIESVKAEWKGGSQPVIYNTDTLDYIKSLLTVTAVNNDGTDYGAVEDGEITLSGTLSAGRSDITVTVNGKSAVISVNVTAVRLTGLSVKWLNGSQNVKVYASTNPADIKGYIEVKAIYNNNAEGVVLSSDEYEISANFTLGDSASPVMITFNGVSDGTLTVKVEASELTAITAVYSQGNKVIYSSTELDALKDNLVVTAKFSGASDVVLGNDEYTLSGDLTKGACVITVTYNGKTATFTVNVTEVALASISVSFDAAAAGTVYTSADLDALKAYLTVTAVYGDNSSKTVTAESYKLSGNLSESGVITVTYGGKTATFTVNVESVIVETLSVSYSNGEAVYASASLDELKQFLTVTATYNDKTSAEVFSYSLSGKLTAGKTCTVTVTYDGKTATFDVAVAEDPLTSLTAVWKTNQPVVYPYTDIEELRNYIKVTANGAVVEGYTLTGDLKSPSATVTVTYGGMTAILSVTVTSVPEEADMTLSATFAQGNVKIFEGADLSVLEGYLTVTASYGEESKTVQAGSYKLSGTLSAGTSTITVTYNGKTATFGVKVSKVELAYISATFNQSGEVKVSAQLSSLTVLTVTAYYTDGSYKTVTDYALSGDLEAGKDCAVTVTYGGKTAQFTVSVSAEPVTFTLSASYTASGKVYTSTNVEDLRDGITVTAHYSDGSEKTVEGFKFVTTSLTQGNCTVYVMYGTETASVTVAVLGVEIESVSAGFNPTDTVYSSASLDDLAKYLTVTAVNNDGSAAGEIKLTAGSYKLEGELKAGKQTITLTILGGKGAGLSATFEVEVAGVKVTSLTVSPESITSEGIYSTTDIGELKNYITVTANYNDGSTKTLLADDYNIEGTLEAGKTCTITVTYNGVSQKFTVKVEEEVLTRLEVTYNQTSAVYSSDSVEDLASKGALTVTAYYNDGTSSMTVEDGYTLSGQLTAGNCLVTVNYGGLSDTFEVNVTAVTLVSISATLGGDAPALYTSTAVDTVKQFITVKATYSNGESKTLSADDYEIANEALTAGVCALSIFYDGKSCTLNVSVTAVKLEGIAVEHTTLPAIFANYDIEELKNYLTVTATYTDGKMTEVTEYGISASLVAGEICTVTVTFGGQNTSFDIEVQAKALKEISAQYNGGEVDASASLEDIAANVTVTAYYTDGTYETVSAGFTLSGDLKAPSSTLTVNYGGKTDEITVPVSNAVNLTGITAELTGNATVYSSADVQKLKNVITVTAHYDNGSTKVIPADGYTLSGTLNADGGASTLTVTLNSDASVTAEIEINVVKVQLESITVAYSGGSLLVSDKLENLSGLTVKGINNDGTSFDIEGGYTISGDLTVGECEIIVTYNGKTAAFTVNVTDENESGVKVTVTGLSASWTAEQPVFYATADTDVLEGYAEAIRNYIEVTATYSDGASKPVTGYTVEGVTLSGSTARVTLGFGGKTAYIDIALTAVELEELFADFDCADVIYTSASLGSLTQYLKVTGLNNDGSAYDNGNAIPSNAYTLSGELTAGKCVITVTYNGKTAEFTVEVTAVKVTSLTVTPSADLPEIYTTSNLNDLKQYIEVFANYNDGRPAPAVTASDYTLSGELLAGRECEITVTYNGAVGTFKVNVKSSVLSKITAEYDADKTAPVIYSSTDINTLKDYLKVTASFTGGAEDRVLGKEEYSLSGDLTKDACQITVVYNGKTAYFLVNVTEVALITLSAEFDGANAPEVFSTTSLEDLRPYITVTAYYSDGNKKQITGYTFASVKLAEGENTVTVNYGVDYSASFTLTVTGVKLGGISAEFDVANAPKVFRGTSPESLKEWLTVTAEYTDGKTAEVYDYTVTGTLEAGKTCTLTVSYGGKSATFDVTVEKKSIDRIEVNYNGAGAVEVTATLQDLAKDVTVTVYYDDDTSETVATGFTVEGSVIPGTNRVFTVNYADKQGTFTVTVNNAYTLSKITAVFEQGNTRVYAGKTKVDTLKNMLTVTAHYVDALGYSAGTRVLGAGEYEIVGNIDVAGSVSLKATFSQKEAQFTVTVTGRELDSITAVFNSGSEKITASTHFDVIAKYLTVTGLYNDGTPYNDGNPIPSNEYSVTGDLIAGKVCTLTVRCSNVSATFDVAVDAEVYITGVTVTFDQTAVGTVYSSSDISVLHKGLSVTVNYSDGQQRTIAYPNYTIECDLAGGAVNPVIYVVYAPYGTQKITAVGTLTVTPVTVETISASFNQNGKPITSATTVTLEQMIADGEVFLTVVGVNNDGTFAGVLSGYALSYDFTNSGEVEVDYDGVKTSFNVIVLNRELASLAVSYSGDAVIFENESMDVLKDKLTVQAIYTSGSPDTLANDDYTLTYAEVSRDSEKIGYTVTVEYFDKKFEIGTTVYVTLLKLKEVSAQLDPAYASEVVIYDSMSAQQAAELVENYLTLKGLYNDNKTETSLGLSEFTVTGDLSSSSNGKVQLTLTYDADTALNCTVEVEVTKVALSGIEVTYVLQHTTAVYTTNTLADLENLLETNKILLDITANFNNGSTRVLSFGDYTISAEASEFNDDGETFKQGKRTITVTYVHGSRTETCTFEITVSPVNVESLEANIIAGNTVYTTTTLEEFYTMLSVVAQDSDGRLYFPSKDDYTLDIAGDKPFLGCGASGEITVTVTYGGKTKTLTVSVSKAVLTIDVSGMEEYDFDPSLTTQQINSGAKLMLGDSEVTDLTVNYSHAAFSSLSDLALNSDNKRYIEVTVSFAGDDVYAAVSERITVIVNKAQADMSDYGFTLNGSAYTDGTEVTYDPNASYTLELDASKQPSGITGVTYKIELSYNGSASQVTSIHDSGTYTVTATFTVSGDYETPDPISVTFTINKAQAELDFDGVNRTFTYTGAEQTYTGVGIKTGSQTVSDISYSVNGVPCAGGYSFTNVADGNGVIVTVSVAENRNYLGDSVEVALIVNKVALTITANPKEITYGDNPANDGVTASGLINGETLESLGVTFEYSYNYEGTGGKLGDYGDYSIELKVTAGDLGNYDVTLVAGVLTVKQKTVKIEWTLTDVTYDGKAHAPMATYVNVYGVTVLPTVTLADGSAALTDGKAVNAGTYNATAVRSDTNYIFEDAEYVFEIKKADFSVTKSGDSWFAAGLDFDIDKLITLDSKDNGSYVYIGFIGSADVEILFSRNAYKKGTSIPSPEDDSTITVTSKPQNVSAAGSFVINFRIKDKNGNHNDYNGQWSLDILDEADPDTKFVQIIFTKAYSFEYGLVPESEAELKALAEKLWDEGYIDTSAMRLEKSVFLGNAHLVLKADNRTPADKDTGYGYYTMYFEWNEGSAYEDWLILYKKDNTQSDSNAGKLEILKKKLTAVWSETSFISDGTVHLPSLTISGFNDGSVYELSLANANGGTFIIEKDGRTLTLTVSINGDLTSAGAHVITLTLDNVNFDIEGGVTAISITAPAVNPPEPVTEEGLSPLMIGIIAAVAVLAVLLIIVIIVVIKRKPSVINNGSDDGFDDYFDE